MTTTQQEWNIKERGETCQGCSKHFDDEEPFYSRLDFGAEGYTRRDYCAVCWTDSARRAALSTWKSVYKMPPPPEPEPLQASAADAIPRLGHQLGAEVVRLMFDNLAQDRRLIGAT